MLPMAFSLACPSGSCRTHASAPLRSLLAHCAANEPMAWFFDSPGLSIWTTAKADFGSEAAQDEIAMDNAWALPSRSGSSLAQARAASGSFCAHSQAIRFKICLRCHEEVICPALAAAADGSVEAQA